MQILPRVILSLSFPLYLLGCAQSGSSSLTDPDAAIKDKIVSDSREDYQGNCPCPYNLDAAGRKCGERSAYSRTGGVEPICFHKDISAEILEDYRHR